MLRNWIKLTVPVMALTLAIVGCEFSGGAERLTGPGDGPANSDGVTTETKYRAVKGFCDKNSSRSTSSVIRPNRGGELGLAGNLLVVPTDAVTEPTLFVMEVNNAGCNGKADLFVKLSAFQQDADRKYTISVGHLGFLKPLDLRLNTDPIAEKVDPDQLRIVWQKTDGSQEVYPTTLDTAGKKVWTTLNHFSDYLLAMP